MGYAEVVNRRRRALSLVEVLLAGTVLSVMLVPMMGMFRLGNRFSISGERDLIATLLAHEIVERVRGEMDRWTERATRETGVPAVRLDAPKGYTYGITRREVERGLEDFTVTVRWREDRVERKIELHTLVSRTPGQKVIRKQPDAGFLSRQRDRNDAFAEMLRRRGGS